MFEVEASLVAVARDEVLPPEMVTDAVFGDDPPAEEVLGVASTWHLFAAFLTSSPYHCQTSWVKAHFRQLERWFLKSAVSQ